MKAGIFCGALCSNSAAQIAFGEGQNTLTKSKQTERERLRRRPRRNLPFRVEMQNGFARRPPCACVRACEWIHLTWLALCMLTQYIPRERVWYNICSNFFILNPSKVHFERSGARICSLCVCEYKSFQFTHHCY
jgi:hypothetical protein